MLEVEVERVPGLLTYHFYVHILYDSDRVRIIMFRDLESEARIHSVSTDGIDLPFCTLPSETI